MAQAQKAVKEVYADGTTVLSNIRNKTTNQNLSYFKTTTYADGSPMTDAKVDGDIYKKEKGTGDYFVQALDLTKSRTLTVNSISDLRLLSLQNQLLIRLGYYEKVETKGYYSLGDGGGIDYLVNFSGVGVDDGFLIIRPSVSEFALHFNPNIKEEVNVKIAGAKGDGLKDDTIAFKKAAALAVKMKLPKGVYLISEGFDLTSNLIGNGQVEVEIRAMAPMPYLIKLSNRNQISGCYINSNTLADQGLLLIGSNGSKITQCRIENAVFDNIKLSETGNNSNTTIENCLIRICGKSYNNGTVSGTANSDIITFTGSADLTTLGFRVAQDFIFIEGILHPFEIIAVSASSMTLYPPLPSDIIDVNFYTASGANINIGRNGDNSCIQITGNTMQASLGVGVQDNSLYGAFCRGNTYEFNKIARVVGCRGNSNPTYTACEYSYYVEMNTIDFLFAYSLGNPVLLGNLGEEPKIHFYNASVPVFDGKQLPQSSGDWSPIDASPAQLPFSGVIGRWVKTGSLVKISATLTYPLIGGAHSSFIGGLPFPVANPAIEGAILTSSTVDLFITLRGYSSNTLQPVTQAGDIISNGALNGATITFTMIYETV